MVQEPVLLGKEMLSQFQKDKFVHFFYHVLDLNMDHVISQVITCSLESCQHSFAVVFTIFGKSIDGEF